MNVNNWTDDELLQLWNPRTENELSAMIEIQLRMQEMRERLKELNIRKEDLSS